MHATITVRPVRPGDFPFVADLIDRNRADRLTAQQRADLGFVQGRWDVATLQRLVDGPGMFLAEVGGVNAGVALSTAPRALTAGPAGRTNELAQQHFGPDGFFLYGPVVVEQAFRGIGVLRLLADALLHHAGAQYPAAVAFVEASNLKSVAVHHHLGWRDFATFRQDGRDFVALAQDLRPIGAPR